MNRFMSIMIILCLLSLSCDKDQMLAEDPTYISVDTVEFFTKSGQGTDRQLISELWVYADSQFIGSFPVPSTFPVLGKATLNLDFFAGIRANAQALSPQIYPLLAPVQVILDATPGQEVQITPRFSYGNQIVLAFNEDFEVSNLFSQDLDGDSATFFMRTSERAIEGISARAILNETNQQLEVASKFAYQGLPTNGLPVFLELEYTSDIPLAVGLRQPNGAKNYKLILFPQQDKAQKIYLDLAVDIQQMGSSAYEVLFKASFDEELSKQQQEVTLDNLKLLHFRP
jgi:hypothetical protein